MLILNIVAFLFMLGTSFSAGIFSAYIKALGGTAVIISLASSALYLTRGTSSIFIDKLAKKLPYKTLFIIAFIGSAISSLLFALPTNAVVGALFRMVQGIFSGFYWVLINIYAASLGSKSLEKFKNLSSVTIWLNIGGFLGCLISGKIASVYSPNISFYISAVILILGALFCSNLSNIQNSNSSNTKSSTLKLTKREKTITFFALLASSINAYIGIGIPLYILELGGSYKEIGTTTALGILSGAIIIAIAPKIKQRFSYRTIMRTDYLLVIINLFFIFYFKSIFLIYFLQAILIGIVALERNLWYGVLQDYSKNFNKTIGFLRGVIDYFGAALFIGIGYFVQLFGSLSVALSVCFVAFVFFIIINIKPLSFLKYKSAIHVNGVAHQYDHMFHKV